MLRMPAIVYQRFYSKRIHIRSRVRELSWDNEESQVPLVAILAKHDRCCLLHEQFDLHDEYIPKNHIIQYYEFASLNRKSITIIKDHLTISNNSQCEILQFLLWDRPVDQIARSSQHLVYLDLSRPRRCKVKSRKKHCKIDKRL